MAILVVGVQALDHYGEGPDADLPEGAVLVEAAVQPPAARHHEPLALEVAVRRVVNDLATSFFQHVDLHRAWRIRLVSSGGHGRVPSSSRHMLLRPASLLGDGGGLLRLLVSLCFLSGNVDFIVLTFLNDAEQLIELVEATENHDGPRLPVHEVALNELVVLLPGQCLHEKEVLPWDCVLDDGRPDRDLEVSALRLHVQTRPDLFRQLVVQGSQVRERRGSSETLIKCFTSSCR